MSFKMASEEEKTKLAEKCKELKNEELKQPEEKLVDGINIEEDARQFNKNKDETKDADLSENESESFEDAVDEFPEDMKEKLKNVDIEKNVFDEQHEKHGHRSDDEDAYLEPSEPLTDEQKLGRKSLAEEHKKKGNEYFKNSEFPEARELYTTAIKTCPPEFPKEKSIFYSNRAACLVRMEMYEDAIRDSTKALELNPDYIKARLRRAQCYEHEDKLEEALEDYQKVLETDKSCVTAREAVVRLPEQIKIKHEKMKEEMLGKLKDLGNLFLKPFGLSTNNFNVQQDPNSGGYSINFQQ